MGFNPPTNDPIQALQRQQDELARAQREALSMGGTQPFQAVRKLQEQIRQLQDVVQFLTGQQGVDSKDANWSLTGTTTASLTWPGFDGSYDPSITVTAPQSGRLRVDLSCSAWMWVQTAGEGSQTTEGDVYLSFDVRDPSGSVVRDVTSTDLDLHAEVFGAPGTVSNLGASLSCVRKVSGLTAGTQYTVRARRGYRGTTHNLNNAVAFAWTAAYESLAIVKVGA